MIEWLNSNNGFVMAILTFVYVVATIIICRFNYKSAKASSEQTDEIQRQYNESNRGRIIPKIVEANGIDLCLVFENIGKDVAKDVSIKINQEWIDLLSQTKSFSESAEVLEILCSKKNLFFTVAQKLTYCLCAAGPDFKKIGEKDLIINISYTTCNKKYKDEFIIPLSGYNHLISETDIVRIGNKQIKELKNIANSIDKLSLKK